MKKEGDALLFSYSLLLSGRRLTGGQAGAPGPVEVVAAAVADHIQHLSGQIEPQTASGAEIRVHFVQRHAAAGDLRLFPTLRAGHMKAPPFHALCQYAQLLLSNRRDLPGEGGQPRLLHQGIEQFFMDQSGQKPLQRIRTALLHLTAQLLHQFLRRPLRQQIHRQFRPCALPSQQAGELKNRNAGQAVIGELYLAVFPSELRAVPGQHNGTVGPNPL